MRKNNNQYLEKINENVGGQVVDERKPNNWYLRSIAKNTGSQEIHGHRTDNYYLKQIAENTEDMDIAELTATIQELREEVEDLTFIANNEIVIFGDKNLIQLNDTVDLTAYCKADGEKVVGGTVYFYEVIE